MLPSELIKQVRKIEIRTRRVVDEIIGGAYHSVFKGRGIEFDEVREYTPEELASLLAGLTYRAWTSDQSAVVVPSPLAYASANFGVLIEVPT